MKTNEIEMTRNGSVISKHPGRLVCTYHTRHRILKVPMEDGSIFEQELKQKQAEAERSILLALGLQQRETNR